MWKPSMPNLVKNLLCQVKTFIREEIQLAKKEVAEKISKKGRQSAQIAVGGLLSYAGLIAFLAGVGVLLAYMFQRLALDPALATFLGLGIVGSVMMIAGALVVLRGVKALKAESIVPQKAIETLEEHGIPSPKSPDLKQEETRTSQEIKADVHKAGDRIEETVEELQDRITLKDFRRQASIAVRTHPYRWSFLAVGTALAASVLLARSGSKDSKINNGRGIG